MTNERIAVVPTEAAQARFGELLGEILSLDEPDPAEGIKALSNILLRAADVGWQEAVHHISEEPGLAGISPAFGPRTPFTDTSEVIFTEDEDE